MENGKWKMENGEAKEVKELKTVLDILCNKINSLKELDGEMPEALLMRNGFEVTNVNPAAHLIELVRGTANIMIAYDMVGAGRFETITIC